MSTLGIRLLGRFNARLGETILDGLDAPKVQELFAYLVLHRDRPHSREALSDLLWCDSPSIDSRKCLRQALWRLQTVLDTITQSTNGSLLLVESKWVQFNQKADLWVDVEEFEQAFLHVQRLPAQGLQPSSVQSVRAAIQLYRGDLLEGCYQDWCLFERERLQSMYLAMLEKLMVYHVTRSDYEEGLNCGARILRHDAAHERTHRRLMRLHYLLGNRTAALRQYERCVNALRDALDVAPSERTLALYEQIRSGQPANQENLKSTEVVVGTTTSLLQMLSQLGVLQKMLGEMQQQLQQMIQLIEMTVDRQT